MTEPDPYLCAAPAPLLAGLSPDLAAILRVRRDRALAREAARSRGGEAGVTRPISPAAALLAEGCEAAD
jgi:hypothetical protein